MRVKLREEMQIEFSIQNGILHILDGIRTPGRHRLPRVMQYQLKMALFHAMKYHEG